MGELKRGNWGKGVVFVALALTAGSVALGQGTAAPKTDAAATHAFEVVSIKPLDTKARIQMFGLMTLPDGVRADAVSLSLLIRMAYGGYSSLPSDDSVTGLPDWAKTDNFVVEARMSDADSVAYAKLSQEDKEQRRQEMLRAMLADRFKLKVHLEKKQAADYDLVVAKGGSKLTEGTVSTGMKGPDGKVISSGFMRMSGQGKVDAQGFTMDGLSHFLTQPMSGLGRRVVDKTGLKGTYNFKLEWAPDAGLGAGPQGAMAASPPPRAGDAGPSIFTALEEQLGLKLQPSTGSFDVVVVEHVERPSEN